MLERFNFYDIYAYLIPGFVVLGLWWLPYFLSGGSLPEGSISEGLAIVAVAYMAGHVLQTFAKELWSSSVAWLGGKRVYPTRALLDDQNTVFSAAMKMKVKERVAADFQIDFAQAGAYEDAWRLCRTALKSRKAASYVEQYHGMYNFMKGVATAFAYAAPYYVGWAIGTTWELDKYSLDVPQRYTRGWILGVLVVVLLLGMSLFKSMRRRAFTAVPIVTAVLVSVAIPCRQEWSLGHACRIVIATGLLIVSLRQVEAFRRLFRAPNRPDSDADKKAADARTRKMGVELHITRFALGATIMGGGILGGGNRMVEGFGIELMVLAGVAWIIAVQCAGAYHFFAREFAAAIFRDYWAAVNGPKPDGQGSRHDNDRSA
jgi:hypothetical protein